MFWILCFFFNDTATTEIYTLSLHDALPISTLVAHEPPLMELLPDAERWRSEEHTSELQSRPHLVCRLLLEKKKSHSILHVIHSYFRPDLQHPVYLRHI